MELGILTLPSLYTLRLILTTSSIIGEWRPPNCRFCHRFPRRHGGDLQSYRHHLMFSQANMSSAGVRYSNKLPSKGSLRGKKFKNILNEFLIKQIIFSHSGILVYLWNRLVQQLSYVCC